MPRLSWDEYQLLTSLRNIITTGDPKYQDDYVTIVHQVYEILQRKYKFNLKDQYIGADGDILERKMKVNI